MIAAHTRPTGVYKNVIYMCYYHSSLQSGLYNVIPVVCCLYLVSNCQKARRVPLEIFSGVFSGLMPHNMIRPLFIYVGYACKTCIFTHISRSTVT